MLQRAISWKSNVKQKYMMSWCLEYGLNPHYSLWHKGLTNMGGKELKTIPSWHQDMIMALRHCLPIILFNGAYVLQDKYTNSKHSVPKTSSKSINVNVTWRNLKANTWHYSRAELGDHHHFCTQLLQLLLQ